MSTSREPKPAIILPTIVQQTDSHCGPAVVQLLLANLDITVTQDQVVDAARVRTKIARHGTRPDQLARAVAQLAPDTQFWFQQPTSIKDLTTLVQKHHWPVAINWQGLFYDTVEEEQKKSLNDEHGHYSVVTKINPQKDQIVIADPYSEYAKKPRVFSLKWFEKRWWDVDHLIDRKTGLKDSIKTKRFIFIIVPKDEQFPQKLHMKLPDKLDILKKK